MREFFANLFTKLDRFRLLAIGVIETHDDQFNGMPGAVQQSLNTVVDFPFISITGMPFSTTCTSAQEDFLPIFPRSVEAKITLFLDFGV